MNAPGRMRGRAFRLAAVLAFALLLAVTGARAGEFITVASTTSTQNAGLFDHLLPLFEAESGIEVRVVAVGTGQALRLARNGDADLLLVHDKPSEEAFVAEGYGSERFDLMYNDFVVVGPARDPAGSPARRTRRRRSPRSRQRRRPSSAEATTAAPTGASARSGPPPGWTPRARPAPGIARRARAWGRRSTRRP